jgi:hypothetical protein
VLLKTLILLKKKNGEDMRDHIRNFFDFVDKLEEMELCIINDLLAILLLYSIPDEYEPFRLAIETQKKTFQMPCSLIKILVGQVNPRNRKILKLNVLNFACHTCGKVQVQKRNPQNQPERQKSL